MFNHCCTPETAIIFHVNCKWKIKKKKKRISLFKHFLLEKNILNTWDYVAMWVVLSCLGPVSSGCIGPYWSSLPDLGELVPSGLGDSTHTGQPHGAWSGAPTIQIVPKNTECEEPSFIPKCTFLTFIFLTDHNILHLKVRGYLEVLFSTRTVLSQTF